MQHTRRFVVAGILVLALAGAGATAAVGASGGSPSAQPRAYDRATAIADSLSTPQGRAHYGLTQGRLVSVDVCVRGSCVHRNFAPPPSCTANTTCIGTAYVARKFAHDVTIAAEIS